MRKSPLGNLNLGRLLEDVLSLGQLVRSEGKTRMRDEVERLFGKLDFVTRKEFDAVKAIALAARNQAEDVAAHVGMKKKKTAAKKPAAKKTAAKKKTKK